MFIALRNTDRTTMQLFRLCGDKMKRILKVLTDLKFGFKVGGGFLAVLLLTAVVGGVGFLAIHGLSARFVVADQAAKVAGQVQATSLLREDYLNNPSAEFAIPCLKVWRRCKANWTS